MAPPPVLGLDVAPSTLLPSYDPDTSLVLLTGKVGWGAQAWALGRYRGKAPEASHFTAAIPLERYPCSCTSCSHEAPFFLECKQLHIARSPQGEPARRLWVCPQAGPQALRPLVATWANCMGPWDLQVTRPWLAGVCRAASDLVVKLTITEELNYVRLSLMNPQISCIKDQSNRYLIYPCSYFV